MYRRRSSLSPPGGADWLFWVAVNDPPTRRRRPGNRPPTARRGECNDGMMGYRWAFWWSAVSSKYHQGSRVGARALQYHKCHVEPGVPCCTVTFSAQAAERSTARARAAACNFVSKCGERVQQQWWPRRRLVFPTAPLTHNGHWRDASSRYLLLSRECGRRKRPQPISRRQWLRARAKEHKCLPRSRSRQQILREQKMGTQLVCTTTERNKRFIYRLLGELHQEGVRSG